MRARATLARVTKEAAPAAPPPGAAAADLEALAGAWGGPIPAAYRAFLALHDGWPALTPVLDLRTAREATCALASPPARDDVEDAVVIALSTLADHVVAIDRVSGAVLEIEDGETQRYADFVAFLGEEPIDEDAGTDREYPGDEALARMIATRDEETDRAIARAYAGVPWWCSAAPADLLRRWLWRAAEVAAIDASALLRMVDWGGAVLAVAAGRRAPEEVLARFAGAETPIAWAARLAARPDDTALADVVIAAIDRITGASLIKPKVAEEAHILALALLAAGTAPARAAALRLVAHPNVAGERARALVADVRARIERNAG